jgi:outer membrane protein assembly factor BamB
MDERELADRLDGFLDGLADGGEDGATALDPALARIARRYRALGQSPAPAGARERVRRSVDEYTSPTGAGAPLVLLPGRNPSPNGRRAVVEQDTIDPSASENRRGRAMLELAAAILLIVVLAGGALGGGRHLGRLRELWANQTERNLDVQMYGGDAGRTGAMPGPGPKQTPVERWRTVLSGVGASVAQSAPLVTGEIVVVAQPNGVIAAFDRLSGEQRWRWQPNQSLRFSAAPAVDDGLVFAGAQDGTFVALDVATGIEVWRIALGADSGAPAVVDGTIYVGLGSDPAVSHGLVYVVGGCACDSVVALDAQTGAERWRFQNGESFLFALDAVTGAERWRYDPSGTTLSPPSVAHGSVYTVTSTGTVLAIDAQSGKERWQQDVAGTNGATGFGATPAVQDETVLVSSRNSTVTALDTANGAIRWQRTLAGSVIASPTVTETTVYVGDLNGTLTALALGDGAVQWSITLSGLIGGPITVTNGAIYVLTGDGALISLADAA